MGQRKSKHSRTSYDVAPVVSKDDFQYREGSRQSPVTVNSSTVSSVSMLSTPDLVVPSTDTTTENAARVPAWITEEYFVDLLREQVPQFGHIKNFKVLPALKAGDNYATLMLRVSIEVELQDKSEKHISYMLKVPHESAKMDEMMQTVNIFDVENTVYDEVLSELEALYRAADTDIQLAPRSLKFIKRPPTHTVLLKDMAAEGYKTVNRQAGLDMEHTEWVLKKLAQLHAASAYRVAARGAYSPILTNGAFDSEAGRALIGVVLSTYKTVFLENVAKCGVDAIYCDAMSNCIDTLKEQLTNNMSYNPEDFNVLNHGDCWTNNVLFKHAADGSVADALLVDFQITKYGTPAQDLYYFLLTSPCIDIKLKKFDYFVRFYHDTLIAHLKLLQYPYKMPTLRELHAQLYRDSVHGIIPPMITLPVVLLEQTQHANFDNFVSDHDAGIAFKNALYTNKKYQAQIREILPWQYNRGMLESRSVEKSPVFVPLPDSDENDENDIETLTPINGVPIWVNEQQFTDILRTQLQDFKQIKKFNYVEVERINTTNEAALLQLDFDVEQEAGSVKPVSYMLKLAPDAYRNLLTMYAREAALYNQYLGQFEQLYTEAGTTVNFAPQSYTLSTKVHSQNLFLENLCNVGYRKADRLLGLDETHTKKVLIKLAEFHAATACYYSTPNHSPDLYIKNIFAKEFEATVEKLLNGFFDSFYEVVESFDNNDDYVHKVAKHKAYFINIMDQVNQIDESGFNVLNHGDLWTENIMFQYDAFGNIIHTKFIDFQLAKYGSPAQDLYNFLLSSPSLDLKLEKFDYFVRIYHENLCKNLKLLNYSKVPPTLKQLHKELLEYGAWGFYTVTNVLQSVLLDVDEPEEKYSNVRYRTHASATLNWLNLRGLLDIENKVTGTSTSNIPEWVDEKHFAELVAQHVNDFARITKIKAIPATKVGDNYASTILKVEVEAELNNGSKTEISYMLKIASDSDQTNAILMLWDFFNKENTMYNTYLPDFEQLFKEAGQEIAFGPQIYTLSNAPKCMYVLLEDLTRRGFKNCDRLVGLDLVHTKSVLRKLAQFHAASVKRIERKGEYPQVFIGSIYSEKSRAIFEQMGKHTINQYLICMEQYEGSEEYRDKVKILFDKYIDLMIEHNQVDNDAFNVLNHGDCWLNNVMFQYDEGGNIKETLLIDFQVSNYGAPAQDLYYFLLSSTELGIKVAQFDYLIKYYHDNLTQSLNLLKYTGKAPTLKELHTSLIHHGILGFSTIMGVTSLCLLEPNQHATIEMFTGESPDAMDMFKQLYLNHRYKAHAETVLTWLNRRGLLDV